MESSNRIKLSLSKKLKEYANKMGRDHLGGDDIPGNKKKGGLRDNDGYDNVQYNRDMPQDESVSETTLFGEFLQEGIESVNEGKVDRVVGHTRYKYIGDGRKGQAIVSGPMKDIEKEAIIKRAKKAGYNAKPNMGGGVTIHVESVITEKQFKGLDGIDDKTPLTKISDTKKLKIIQSTGNIISFKVPKGSDRNVWQVIVKGKIKKTRNPQGYVRYIVPGKMINSPFFKSEKDLINGVDWDSVEKARRFNEGTSVPYGSGYKKAPDLPTTRDHGEVNEIGQFPINNYIQGIIPTGYLDTHTPEKKKQSVKLVGDLKKTLNTFWKQHDIPYRIK